MIRIVFAIALLAGAIMAAPSPAYAAPSSRPLPPDVRAFVARRDQCDHFRGEDSDDPERRRGITHSLFRFCTGTDAELARLKKRYRRDARVIRRLARYDPDVE